LLKFYPVDQGKIFIDGVEISHYPTGHLRRAIGIVPQEVVLFGGTIGENIAYGNPQASPEEIREAACKAYAWEFIQTFPDGLNTLVGERGTKLSGGQRQRIAIARAILKNPTILILDEATNSLDAGAEKLIQEACLAMPEKTMIVIAHRLASIRKVDKIYVLAEGKIIEAGTHEELIQNKNGVYCKWLDLQTSSLESV
jgi:ABC-type multidrug transport system fused ATPase/permease subunit